MASKGKQLRAGYTTEPLKRKCQRTRRAAKQEKARDHKETLGKARENIEKPQKAIDRFARGARFARLPGGKQGKANESNEKQEQERKA